MSDGLFEKVSANSGAVGDQHEESTDISQDPLAVDLLEEKPTANPPALISFCNMRKRCRRHEYESCSETEIKKAREDVESCDTEDLNFFKSLLPHVKNINPAQKLLMRGKILEIVSQFAYPTIKPYNWN